MSAFKPARPGSLAMVLFMVLVVAATACGQTEPASDERSETAKETTAAPKEGGREGTKSPSETRRAPERDRGASAARATWDYVALGDSLAAGVGDRRGYVERYADHIRTDMNARVRVINLGVPGQTSPELLRAVRTDAAMRRALGGAQVVTFNIGINDLGRARESYEAGTCGASRNEACLRTAVDEVGRNWEAIIREILALRSGQETIVRTPGLGYVPQTGAFFAPYLMEVNRRIATTAAAKGIRYTEVRLGAEGMGPDGVHPNDRGYKAIANRLRGLGYDP